MKQKNLLLIPVFAILALSTTFAQNADYRSTVSATAGLNVFQFLGLLDGALSDSLGTEVNINTTGSYGLAYDYGVTKWFSIGVAGAFNKASMDANSVDVDREDGTTYTGPIDLSISRTNIALRPLFHYGNRGRVDMYTGFRLGANVWTVKLDADESLTAQDINKRFKSTGATFAAQFIPFGLRGYITPNIGLGFEIGIGGPHYAALQLNYRM